MERLGLTSKDAAKGLRGAAGAAGTFIAVAYAIDAVASGMDDLSRKSAATEASMNGLVETQDALANSNLGKYAEQLGIDLDRLAEDLNANGREGEYVRDVMALINDETGRFSTVLDTFAGGDDVFRKLGVDLGFNADEANKAGTALETLLSRYDTTAGVTATTATATRDLGDAVAYVGRTVGPTAEQIEEARKAYAEARGEATETGTAFFNLGDSLDESKISLRGWLRELEEQAEALAQFRENAEKAAQNGLNRGLIQSLQEAGPAGALRLKQLANATQEQIERANGAWRRGQREIDKYVDSTTKVPKELATTLTVHNGEALRQVDVLRTQLANLVAEPWFVKLGVRAPSLSGMGAQADGFAAGGHTGHAGGPITRPNHLMEAAA